MRLVFRSDASVTNTGFRLRYIRKVFYRDTVFDFSPLNDSKKKLR